jgi:hypothetical protein
MRLEGWKAALYFEAGIIEQREGFTSNQNLELYISKHATTFITMVHCLSNPEKA